MASTSDGASTAGGLAYSWRVSYDAGGSAVSEVYETPTVTIQTAPTTRLLTATLVVTDTDGRQSAAEIRVPVVPNLPPKLDLKRTREVLQCRVKPTPTTPTGTPLITSVPISTGPKLNIANLIPAVVNQPVTLYGNGCDPDGDILRYEFFKITKKSLDPDSQGRQPDGVRTDTQRLHAGHPVRHRPRGPVAAVRRQARRAVRRACL